MELVELVEVQEAVGPMDLMVHLELLGLQVPVVRVVLVDLVVLQELAVLEVLVVLME
jgi:hypothetical protein